jgi:phosphoheptose isomerase
VTGEDDTGIDLVEHLAVAEAARHTLPRQIEDAARFMAERLRYGGKLLACGNGGSAADAQHLVSECVWRLDEDRDPIPAIALTTDGSTLTAIANDWEYAQVFARQVRALGTARDVLVAFSTSGQSTNVLRAAKQASATGLGVIALTGRGGGALAGLADRWVEVPSKSVQRVQEMHCLCIHTLVSRLQRILASAVVRSMSEESADRR